MVAVGFSVTATIRVGNQKGLNDYINLKRIANVKTFFIFGNSIYLKVAHLLAPSISAAW